MTPERKNINYLSQIEHICADFCIESLKPSLAGMSEFAQEGDKINVALVGRFKSGKSSFINSMIGRDIMPVGVLPLTAVITRVRYGEKDKAEVLFLNGQAKGIAFNELSEFIAEEKNPKNVKKVARVDVELTSLQDYSGIQFVDTPGLGSIFQHNTLTSKEWLPRIGAAFLTVSIDHPLSENDIFFLKELGNYTSEINILLAKVDLVSPAEVCQVVDFIQRQVKDQLKKELRVFPFSNKPGYEMMRQAVSTYLQQSIATQVEHKSKEILNHKIHQVVSKCLEYLSLGLSAANSTQESRRELFQELQKEREALLNIQNEIRLVSRDLKDRLWEDSLKIFGGQQNFFLSELQPELENVSRTWEGSLEKTCNAFRKWSEQALLRKLTPVSEKHGFKLAEGYLKIALSSYERVARGFQDRLAQEIEKALHIQFPGAQFDVKVKTPQRPDVMVGSVFMTHWELLWFLIPMRVFRPLVNKHFRSRLPEDVKVSVSRLASQWTESISKSIEDVAQQTKMFIQQEIDTVENLLNKAPDQRKQIEGAIAQLDAIKKEILS